MKNIKINNGFISLKKWKFKFIRIKWYEILINIKDKWKINNYNNDDMKVNINNQYLEKISIKS